MPIVWPKAIRAPIYEFTTNECHLFFITFTRTHIYDASQRNCNSAFADVKPHRMDLNAADY